MRNGMKNKSKLILLLAVTEHSLDDWLAAELALHCIEERIAG